MDTTCTTEDGAASTASAPVSADAAGSFVYTATIDAAGQCTLTAQGSATTPFTAQVTVREPVAVGASVPATADATSGLAATGAPLPCWSGPASGSAHSGWAPSL
ncbi:hypothetical protein AC792_03940 [Arthrobacter sp. RIT-PI-e]|uniref:hypothetical protein n=1 Tax=Arthrobacter sp. RIT-PI-e TaxID=1681197 RepID=UPI000675EAB2|nr:hypothetical protein [Arthrobacter sp. RIT-PI-e]KNC19810.1 hypothetical protein AC792_03940 [Arthrobacter sp. RIT-PI-e]